MLFPNFVSGTSRGGLASYGDTVLHSGTVRGRLGYALSNNWLLFGTAGFAWSYDQLSRTQLSDGVVSAGTEEGPSSGGSVGRPARASRARCGLGLSRQA